MTKNYTVPVTINLAVTGDFPKVVHPEVNTWVGWAGKELLVDETNQTLFTAPYELEDGGMTILSPSFEENVLPIQTKSNGLLSLKVDYASIFAIDTNTDQTAIISLSVLHNVNATDDGAAYDIANELFNKDNVSINEIMFHDTLEDKIYTAHVLTFEIKVESEYIRELEEEYV